MKWFNYGCEVKKLELSFGALNAIVLGEEGRGRQRTLVPCPIGLSEGCDVDLAQTKTGKPKIIRGSGRCSDSWLMAMSSGGIYTRFTWGSVYAMEPEKVELVAKGQGAFGDAGRLGGWDDVLVVVKPENGTWLKICPAGGLGKRCHWFVFVTTGCVRVIKDSEVEVAVEMIDATPLREEKWLNCSEVGR